MEPQPLPLGELTARASTLYERAAAITTPDQADGLRACFDERARRALRAWQEAFAPGDPDAFARRLSWDGLDVVRAMLAVAPGDLARRADPAPWTAWLSRIASALTEVPADTIAACAAAIRDGGLPFHEILAPVVVAARLEWIRRSGTPSSDVVSPSALADLERRLAWELSFFGERGLFELFSSGLAARTGGPADGSAHYDEFIERMLESRLAPLFDTFPVLARQWAIVAEGWVSASAEMVERLAADRKALVSLLRASRDPGPVTQIIAGLSDPHHGRRRVAILVFASGDRIVYKPRSLAFDAAFQSLLRWLSERGLDPAPHALAVLDRGNYGWVEHVARAEFDTGDEVQRYYAQAGALLAIAWLLGGRDLHMENVVATRHGPVLVDLEMFLGPVRSGPQADASAGAGQPHGGRLDQSVLSSGLLTLIESTDAGECYDIGGLQGGRRHATIRTRQWTGLGTDALSYADDVPIGRSAANVVMLAGEPQSPSDHADSVIAGFDGACDVLMAHAGPLADDNGPLAAFSRCATRFLLRPTEQYGRLLALLATPKYQRDGAAGSAACDVLLRGYARVRVRPPVWPLVLAERAAIAALDIPHFDVPCAATSVGVGGSPLMEQPHAQSGLEAARQRIRRLPATRRRERSRLGAALRQTPATRFRTPLWEQDGDADFRPTCIAAAEWIGRELLDVRAADRGAVRPGSDLYAGAAGPMLLFAALAAVTGKPEWSDAAVVGIREVAETWLDEPGTGIGICSGSSSASYALLLGGSLADVPTARRWAERIARGLTRERIIGDRYLDVAAGSAGALLAVLALYAVTRDERWLTTARWCGEHLASAAIRDGERVSWPAADGRRYIGFAHGSAGIGHALLQLHAATGEARWSELWDRAAAFERTAFAGGNWPIADPVTDPFPASAPMIAWCHGAGGLVLARAQALALGKTSIVGELGDGLRTVARMPAQRADHLCCGNFGRVEALFSAGRTLEAQPVIDAALDLASNRLRIARERGHFRLSAAPYEYRVFDPGFFQGLSGIGYQLLRLAAPDTLPSVLTFEVPVRK